MTDSQSYSVALHPINQSPNTRDQHILCNTSATAADLQSNLAPDHPQNPHLISCPLSLKSDTFWTFCNRCRIRYEYQKMYLNQQLLCHHCQQPFMAIEMPAQSANVCDSRPWTALFAASKRSKRVPTSSARPTETATTVQPSSQNANGGPQWAVNMARGDKALEKNVTATKMVDASSAFNAGSPHLKTENPSIKKQINGPKYTNKGCRVTAGSKSEVGNSERSFRAEQVVCNKPRGSKELSRADICSMLKEKARTEIISELNK